MNGAHAVFEAACNEPGDILHAFRGQCERYLIKPVSCWQLLSQLESPGLLQVTAGT